MNMNRNDWIPPRKRPPTKAAWLRRFLDRQFDKIVFFIVTLMILLVMILG